MTNALPTVWEFLTWVMAPKWQGIPIAALIELTLVGLACGALGVLVVLRGLAFIGDALAHASFVTAGRTFAR
jgi:manganese/iron transport system permease protein